MSRRASALACLLAGLVAAGCATKPPPQPTSAASPAVSLGAVIEYRRSGGFAGIDDRISITRDGMLEVRDRQGRHTKAQLSPGDLKELEALLSGWKELAGSPPPPVTPDAFEYSITYDGVTVKTVEFARAPETFDLVRKRIEGMAERAR